MLMILVDQREMASGVPDLLKKEGLHVIFGTLPIGDYALSERLIVERKTIQDFAASIKSKRLFQQMLDLRENCQLPLLIVEGRDFDSVRGVKKRGFLGALAYITVNLQIPVVFTKDREETAEFIAILARRESMEPTQMTSIFHKRKAITKEDMIYRVVEALPDIGPKRADLLIKRFGSLKGIFDATVEELKSVPGFGEGRAVKLYNFIRERVEDREEF
jgi:Fanconi anemia group M protein